MRVLLAGPIAGCTQSEAKDWRDYVSAKIALFGIIGVSPLRCEHLVGPVYSLNHPDPRFGTARAISSKNFFDMQSCDMVLAYLPLALNMKRPSYGTIIELGWAFALRKPTILVTDDKYVREHPVINACSAWVLDNLEDAIDTIVGILEVYVDK